MALESEITQLFGTEFFSFVLPWLFSFAIFYGVLSTVSGGIPKSAPARAILVVAMATLIAPTLSPFVEIFSKLVGSFVVVIGGILIFIILLEVFGIKKLEAVLDEKDKTKIKEVREVSIFEYYGKSFAFVLALIAILVFLSSGAPQALGLDLPTAADLTSNQPLVLFLIFMVLLVWWMVSERD